MNSDTLFATASGETTELFLPVDEDQILPKCDSVSVLTHTDSSIMSAAEEIERTMAKKPLQCKVCKKTGTLDHNLKRASFTSTCRLNVRCGQRYLLKAH
ncbi:hypothetical protein DPMN_190683 [Dreissena polymorpha]|nr:hypothetical protein DPMN_190683 [Dreissena polymorpha]